MGPIRFLSTPSSGPVWSGAVSAGCPGVGFGDTASGHPRLSVSARGLCTLCPQALVVTGTPDSPLPMFLRMSKGGWFSPMAASWRVTDVVNSARESGTRRFRLREHLRCRSTLLQGLPKRVCPRWPHVLGSWARGRCCWSPFLQMLDSEAAEAGTFRRASGKWVFMALTPASSQGSSGLQGPLLDACAGLLRRCSVCCNNTGQCMVF